MLPSNFKDLAELLAQFGRDGDTELAHVNKDEIEMLKDSGGRGSRNPHTGLLEFADAMGGGGVSDGGVSGGISGNGADSSTSSSLGNLGNNSPNTGSALDTSQSTPGDFATAAPAPEVGATVGPIGQGIQDLAQSIGLGPQTAYGLSQGYEGFVNNPGPALASFGANALVSSIPGLGTYNTLAGLSNSLLGTSLPTAGSLVQAGLAQGTPNNTPAVVGGQTGGSEGGNADSALGNLAPAQVTPTTQTAPTPSPTPTPAPTTSASATPVANPYYGGQQDVSSYLQSINAFFNNPVGILR